MKYSGNLDSKFPRGGRVVFVFTNWKFQGGGGPYVKF